MNKLISTSCSLMHNVVDTMLDDEIKSWLAFSSQKVVEVNALAKALAGSKDEAFFSATAASQDLRKTSPRVNNAEVQKVDFVYLKSFWKLTTFQGAVVER